MDDWEDKLAFSVCLFLPVGFLGVGLAFSFHVFRWESGSIGSI
jgi:hypothetical protein